MARLPDNQATRTARGLLDNILSAVGQIPDEFSILEQQRGPISARESVTGERHQRFGIVTPGGPRPRGVPKATKPSDFSPNPIFSDPNVPKALLEGAAGGRRPFTRGVPGGFDFIHGIPPQFAEQVADAAKKDIATMNGFIETMEAGKKVTPKEVADVIVRMERRLERAFRGSKAPTGPGGVTLTPEQALRIPVTGRAGLRSPTAFPREFRDQVDALVMEKRLNRRSFENNARRQQQETLRGQAEPNILDTTGFRKP